MPGLTPAAAGPVLSAINPYDQSVAAEVRFEGEAALEGKVAGARRAFEA